MLNQAQSSIDHSDIRSEYRDLFRDIRAHLVSVGPKRTVEITKSVKKFFRDHYLGHANVLCSHTDSAEYLVDVLVTNFNPKAIVTPFDRRSSVESRLQFNTSGFEIELAVESELGGVGGSSAYGVMKNVVEDYLKLMMVRCKRRVMVFTSLPYAGEANHAVNRVEVLRAIYSKCGHLESGVLLVHLEGAQPISSQVQAIVGGSTIRGFIVAPDGLAVEEIPNL